MSWLGIRVPGAFVGALLVGGVVAEEEQRSEEAREFCRRLGRDNLVRDYRAMEAWAFEDGLCESLRRKRCEAAAWALIHNDYRQPHRWQKQVWADDFLERLGKEAGDNWWAWQVRGDVYSKLVGQLVAEGDGYRRAGNVESATHWMTPWSMTEGSRCWFGAMENSRCSPRHR